MAVTGTIPCRLAISIAVGASSQQASVFRRLKETGGATPLWKPEPRTADAAVGGTRRARWFVRGL